MMTLLSGELRSGGSICNHRPITWNYMHPHISNLKARAQKASEGITQGKQLSSSQCSLHFCRLKDNSPAEDEAHCSDSNMGEFDDTGVFIPVLLPREQLSDPEHEGRGSCTNQDCLFFSLRNSSVYGFRIQG